MDKEPGSLQLTFQSITGRIQRRPLDWETPMREVLRDPEAADFVWCRLQYLFRLPDPRTFPALDIAWTPDELDMLNRFVEHAEKKLATASLIAADDRVTINIADDGQSEDIDARVSAPDVTTGLMAHLRQCYTHDEDASFAKVRKLLSTRLHERGDAELVDVLKAWRRAHAKLDGNTLEELVQERMVEERLMPPEIVQAPASPRQLFAAFWSGDQMHWGDKRNDLKALQRDPVGAALADLAAREAAVDFAHFYIGFAVLVKRPSAKRRPLPDRVTPVREAGGSLHLDRRKLGPSRFGNVCPLGLKSLMEQRISVEVGEDEEDEVRRLVDRLAEAGHHYVGKVLGQ